MQKIYQSYKFMFSTTQCSAQIEIYISTCMIIFSSLLEASFFSAKWYTIFSKFLNKAYSSFSIITLRNDYYIISCYYSIFTFRDSSITSQNHEHLSYRILLWWRARDLKYKFFDRSLLSVISYLSEMELCYSGNWLLWCNWISPRTSPRLWIQKYQIKANWPHIQLTTVSYVFHDSHSEIFKSRDLFAWSQR